MFVFVNGFFANNKNLNLQIGFIIILGNKSSDKQEMGFRVTGNILYWVSNKYYKIIKSVLTNKIYNIISGFNIRFVFKIAIAIIMDLLGLLFILIIIYINNLLLY